jgi:hypothetical protein
MLLPISNTRGWCQGVAVEGATQGRPAPRLRPARRRGALAVAGHPRVEVASLHQHLAAREPEARQGVVPVGQAVTKPADRDPAAWYSTRRRRRPWLWREPSRWTRCIVRSTRLDAILPVGANGLLAGTVGAASGRGAPYWFDGATVGLLGVPLHYPPVEKVQQAARASSLHRCGSGSSVVAPQRRARARLSRV